jgi:hypothetical protein
MTANVASVQFGRIRAPEDIAFDAFYHQTTETDSLTGGFKYDFQGDGFSAAAWQLNGYYQTGETDVRAIQGGGIASIAFTSRPTWSGTLSTVSRLATSP